MLRMNGMWGSKANAIMFIPYALFKKPWRRSEAGVELLHDPGSKKAAQGYAFELATFRNCPQPLRS
jgi:hypothetical protein